MNKNDSSSGMLGGQDERKEPKNTWMENTSGNTKYFFSRLDFGKPRCFGKGLALCVPKIGLLDGVGGRGVRECCFRQDVPSEKGRGGVRALSQKQVRDLEKRDIAGDCKECGVCTRSGEG